MTRYKLIAVDGTVYHSATAGLLGGNRALRIYGRLDCPSARAALPRGYAGRRVFFRNEAAAIAAGYRPCGRCLPERYRRWKRVGSASPAVNAVAGG
jgi:methylphosphotriester-DNA--protein-cysteine methyltransferase